MSPIEVTQSTSKSGRRSVDAFLVGIVLAVPALMGAGALGLF